MLTRRGAFGLAPGDAAAMSTLRPADAPSPENSPSDFLKMFPCNPESFVVRKSVGTARDENGKLPGVYITYRRSVTEEDVRRHLSGKVCLVLKPDLAGDMCGWAQIDHDIYLADDLKIAILTRIGELKLPLQVFSSKSGGLHSVVFFEKPIPCAVARALLGKWAAQLGDPGAEVFPKPVSNGKLPFGVALPFFGEPEQFKMFKPRLFEPPMNGDGMIPDYLRTDSNGETIPQGHRHQTMLSLAGGMRARGLNAGAILTALKAANVTCTPPLDESELQKLAGYVATKPTGFRGQRPMETSAEVEIDSYSSIACEKIHWLWFGRIARGKLNLFVGDPGEGKSLATIDLSARVSTGTAFPDGAPCEAADVLILSAEDDPKDTVKPRLVAAGADVSHVHRVNSVKVTLADGQTGQSFFNLERDVEKLGEALDKFPAIKLLIIDPISAYMGGRIDTHNDAAVRSVLAPLAGLAAERGIAIVAVMHLRKSDAIALLRVSGSVGFVAAARIVWGFGKDPDNPERRVMIAVKNNLAAFSCPLAYRIAALPGNDAASIEWLKDQIMLNADEVLNSDPRHRRTNARQQDRAEEWLQDLLKDGPVPQQRIEDASAREDFSWATVRRAKDTIRAKSRKAAFGGGWLWELPKGAQDDRP